MIKSFLNLNPKKKEVKEMKKIIKCCFVFAIVVLAFALVNTSARADTILSLINPGPNQASDENREYLIDREGTVPGQLDVGDSLRGSINFNTFNSASANVGGTTGNNELSGVFQILTTSVTAIPTGGGNSIFYFTFAPDPAFVADLGGGMTAAPVGFVPGPGAIAVLFEGSGAAINYAGDFDDPAPSTPPAGPDDGAAPQTVPPSSADVSGGPYATEEAFLATAYDGTWFMTIGFLGLLGEGADAFTIPTLTNSVLNAFAITSGSAFATSNLGLNLLALGPAAGGLQINRITPSTFGGVVDFALSQQLKGVSDLDTPFEVSSNTNVSFNAVPEPSTILLLGSGLLGVGALYSKRKMKK